jgi:hypothetical protein
MLALFSPLKIVRAVAVTYAICCAVTWFFMLSLDPGMDPKRLLRIVLAGALILDVALWGAVYLLWRPLWARVPALNSVLFPDLNGQWRMSIEWSRVDLSGEARGTVEARATIRQSLLHMSMEVESQVSDSETLIARPKKDPESGRPMLYYVYRVVPRKTSAQAGSAYEGAAILKFDADHGARLRGNYFTSRMTQGYFTLERQ